MRIQHNIAAINSHRNLGGNNSAVSKNLEKLSSGYRINKAGDDAAGLAISEKMRAQIKGLETAQANSQDGISLVQTAEGNLTEVHSMLNRMVELATQSANGTYDNETDRANLQKEIESLKSEIDRISESANYNGIKLLDGSLSSVEVKQTMGTGQGSSMSSVQQFSITKAFQEGEVINIDGKDYTVGTVTNADDGMIHGGTAEEQAASLARLINADADANPDFKVKATVVNNKIKLEATESGYRFGAPTVKAAVQDGTSVEGIGVTMGGTTGAGGVTGAVSFDFSTAVEKGGNFKNGESITINGQKFTFVTDKNDPTKNGVVIGSDIKETLSNLADQMNAKNAKLQDTGANAVEGTWEFSKAKNELIFYAKDAATDMAAVTASFNKPASINTDVTGSIAMMGEKIAAKGASGSITIPNDMTTEQIKNSSIMVGGKEYAFSSLKNEDGTQALSRAELASALIRKINNDPENELTAQLDKNDGSKVILTTKEVGAKVTDIGEVKMVTRAAGSVTDIAVKVAAVTDGEAAAAATKATVTLDFSNVDSHDLVAGSEINIGGATFAIKTSTNGGIEETLKATLTGNVTGTIGGVEGKFTVSGTKVTWTATTAAETTTVNSATFVYTPATPGGENIADKVNIERVNGKNAVTGTQAEVQFSVTGTSNFQEGESITINGKTMTFGNETGQVQIGASFTATMQNVVDKLNADEAASTLEDSDGKKAKGSWNYDDAAGTLTWKQTAATDFNAKGNYSINNSLLKDGDYLGKTATATEVDANVKAGSNEVTISGIDGEMGAVSTNKSGQTEISFNTLKKGDTFQVGDTKYQVGEAGDEVKDGYTLLAVTANENGKFNGEDVAEALGKELRGTASVDGNKVIIGMQDGKYVDAKPIHAGGLDLQVGETNDDYQKVTVSVGNMGTKSLGIADVDISNQDGAAVAIDKIKAAINQVSSTRGDLGAIQNRLEHTINNLGVTTENMTAAESRIRDVDMAKEMMDFTKNNILTQAAQAMLAQANQLPQGVLQLLR